MRRIYLDHSATNPVLPEVREAMLPYLDNIFGNPSSLHDWGDLAREALDTARLQVISLSKVWLWHTRIKVSISSFRLLSIFQS
jgi:cysteine sulfinate desulfinase/cysteine desulfurase-like protein